MILLLKQFDIDTNLSMDNPYFEINLDEASMKSILTMIFRRGQIQEEFVLELT